MPITTKIQRLDGAVVMAIPPSLLKSMNVDIGAEVSLTVSDGQLIARPIQTARKRYPQSKLLNGADAMAALNAEVAEALDGDAIGYEIT